MTENIYHRYLNLPFGYPKPKRFNAPSDTFIIYMGGEPVYPPFLEWVQGYGLEISNIIEGFYTGPNGDKIRIHTDPFIKPGVQDVCKINFTWGPDTSVTRWFQVKDESKLLIMKNDDNEVNQDLKNNNVILEEFVEANYTAKMEDVDLVYEQVINKPSLINVGQLHGTYNPHPTEMRWTLSFTLLKNKQIITFNDATKLFQQCIIP
jgi:hypothetical protein